MDSVMKGLMGQCPQNFWARTASAVYFDIFCNLTVFFRVTSMVSLFSRHRVYANILYVWMICDVDDCHW